MINIKDNSPFVEYCNLLKSKYRINNKVLFIQLPQFLFNSFNPKVAKQKGYYAFPPTGLQYLHESLKTRKLELKILDLNLVFLKKIHNNEIIDLGQWISILDEYLKSFQPSIVGISCMYSSNIPRLKEALSFLKEQDRHIILTGGVIPTYEWKYLISEELCHFVVKGEGENKVNYLFDQLMDENRCSLKVRGICFKYKDNLYESQGRQDVVSIKGNLIDSYSLIEIEDYYKYGSLNPFSRMKCIDKAPFAVIQMSRGCRGHCTFCSTRDFIGQGVRKRPVGDIIEEMEFLIEKKGVRHLEWLDDDLLFYKNDFLSLLEQIVKKNLQITWSANNGLIATSIDENTLGLMRDSGCIGFKMGIESGNSEVLEKMSKPASVVDFKKAARLCSRYTEIFVGANIMLGFPKETFLQMLDSFKFYLDLDLDWAAFTICQPIRGAEAFDNFRDFFQAQIINNRENINNFIPARESSNCEIITTDRVLRNLDVFKIDYCSIPCEEQIKEIWFTFNIIANYINNKNLRPEGRVGKFISWVEMAQLAYPDNPYMCLFLSLAYIIEGNYKKAEEYHDRAKSASKNEYWIKRLDSFGLLRLLDNYPIDQAEVFRVLGELKEAVSLGIRKEKAEVV